MADTPQKIDAKKLYGIVADTLPMEGRDYTLDVTDGDDGKQRLSITPLTDIGKAFAPLLAAKLAKPMQENGVEVQGAGPAVQEANTVRAIREKIEAEAAAARAVKIREASIAAAKRHEALQDARRVRIERTGMNSPESLDERAAATALSVARLRLSQLEQIEKQINRIREKVDRTATAAAERDAKTGRSWGVDMDAELDTPFDRQDVTAKLTEKENLIDRMARHAVELDTLGGKAVELAKQYIIPKKK